MSTSDQVFAIAGGGLAAAEAAKTLRAEGFDGRIVIVGDEPGLPYERPPLTKDYLRGETGADKLLAQQPTFYEEKRVDVLAGRRATGLDAGERRLTLDDGTVLPFDRLLIATGARAARPPLPGIDSPWVHLVRTMADSDRLRAAAAAGSSAVVAGGGWIAAEVAASLRQLGLEVTLVVPGAEVLERHLGPVAGRTFSENHERHGVRLVRSSRVAALEEAGARRGVRLASGELIEGDLVVLGFGVVPATELAAAGGLEVDDGVVADDCLATAAPGIFVAGDVASAWNPRYGTRVRSEHWDNARRQGRAAAKNMLGRDEPYDRVPYFYSDQFELGMELLGRPAAGDDVLVRTEDKGIVVFFVRDGRASAGMHVDLWDAKKPIDRIVSAGALIDAKAFADPAVPLEDAVLAEPV